MSGRTNPEPMFRISGTGAAALFEALGIYDVVMELLSQILSTHDFCDKYLVSHTEFGGRGPPQNENQGAGPPPKSKVRGR